MFSVLLSADPASVADVQEEPSGLAAGATREPCGGRSETRIPQEEEAQVIPPHPMAPNTLVWCDFVRDDILIHI